MLGHQNGLIDENDNDLVTRLRNDTTQLFENLPRVDYIESLALTCDDKSFFETLLMTIKNTTLSEQQFFYKLKSISKDNIKKMAVLKVEYVANQDEIFALEGRLSRIVDSELRDELALVRNFEKLNDEKITPYFMALAKQATPGAVLSDIRDVDGRDFIDCTGWERYITEYYSNLYKRKDNITVASTTIEDFLGEVSHHPDVAGSKLTDVEKADLDRPLTIQELDKSIKKSNKKIQHSVSTV
jgi:hypothetical protein